MVSVGVEPAASPVITQILTRQPVRPQMHNIQGIGAGFIPDTLDLAMVDAIELVTDEEAIETALAPRPRRGHLLRDLQRRCRGGRAATCAPARIRREDSGGGAS